MPARWITHQEAADIIGCSRHTVERYAKAGAIRRRYPRGRKTPTLYRSSVQAFAATWRQRQQEQAVLRKQREARTSGPPQDGEVWLDSKTAALVMGVSPQYLGRLALTQRVPAHRAGTGRTSRWWFRRRDIEQLAAARAKARAR